MGVNHLLYLFLPGCFLKPLHTIGKVSLNASILYKNQEIRNKTNLWKFQLISLFILQKNRKKCIRHFCIHSNGRSFRLETKTHY